MQICIIRRCFFYLNKNSVQVVLQLWMVSEHRRRRKHRKIQEAPVTAPKNKETDNCRRIKNYSNKEVLKNKRRHTVYSSCQETIYQETTKEVSFLGVRQWDLMMCKNRHLNVRTKDESSDTSAVFITGSWGTGLCSYATELSFFPLAEGYLKNRGIQQICFNQCETRSGQH